MMIHVMPSDPRELAKTLVLQLRWYMREKTSHNNLIAIPVLDLWAWSALGTGGSMRAEDLEAAARWLHENEICVIVHQQTPSGGTQLQIQMRPECRELTDEQLSARIFPERS